MISYSKSTPYSLFPPDNVKSERSKTLSIVLILLLKRPHRRETINFLLSISWYFFQALRICRKHMSLLFLHIFPRGHLLTHILGSDRPFVDRLSCKLDYYIYDKATVGYTQTLTVFRAWHETISSGKAPGECGVILSLPLCSGPHWPWVVVPVRVK